jgi:hypothetical protein
MTEQQLARDVMTAQEPSRELSTAQKPTRQIMTTEERSRDPMPAPQPRLAATVGRGVLAGLAGTLVMTAFQELVEMPLTGRGDSYAPANTAEKTFGVHPETQQGRKRLNWVTHFALGTVWGAAYGVAAHAGLRGPQAIATTFATVYTGDFVSNTARGLYEPSTWSTQDWAIDLTDKFVQAAATGVIFDQFLDPAKKG